jgi:hypothetical protein
MSMADAARLAEVAEAIHRIDAFSMTKEGAGDVLGQMPAQHRAVQAAEAPTHGQPAILTVVMNPEPRPVTVNRYAAAARRARAGSAQARATVVVLEAMAGRARAFDDNIRFLSRGPR